MKREDLKIGDRVRIIAVPGEGIPNYCIHRDTVRAFKKLIDRGRSVRISQIEHGSPWYNFRFRKKNGTWEYHSMAILAGEQNWVPVKHRSK